MLNSRKVPSCVSRTSWAAISTTVNGERVLSPLCLPEDGEEGSDAVRKRIDELQRWERGKSREKLTLLPRNAMQMLRGRAKMRPVLLSPPGISQAAFMRLAAVP